jgi:preprotein translocase subunit SecB
MRFWLVQTFVRKLTIEAPEDTPIQDSLRFKSVFEESHVRDFAVAFKLVVNLGNRACLRLEYLAHFNTEEDIDDVFKGSHFALANAPAVAYPYLRAYVTQFSVLSGFEPHILEVRSFSPDTRPPTPPALT